MSDTKWFHYSQNNSGGDFDTSFGQHVLIEARDADHANERAESIGLYFDGCEKGFDCDCCGDRWSRAWNNAGYPEPSVYGEPLTTYKGYDGFQHYWKGGKDIQVVPIGGASYFTTAGNE